MFDWIKHINKEYPEFWKKYLSKFDHRSKRFITLNLEISGNDPQKDVIFSFGGIGVFNNAIVVGDSFEVIIPQYKYLHDNGLDNEFIIESKQDKLSENQAIEAFVNYIGNAVLVGHRIHHDVDLINEALEKLGCGRLKNEALDIEIMHRKLNDITDRQFSLDELAQFYKIPSADRMTAIDDAYIMALLFLKLKSRLGIN
ncbi:3'-5' exonuclease [Flavobacterium selenitireducens]|uniref:3'-5' exonuclease n=1 Tax=Flavobacterium selenitireducens TaxID=2722704 RepID=UPI00168BF560|nr:exonuclease domain-containing protein [Flavobacterium selenitireducens]MBD3581016.1 3'-5' exonuclease [Flavobacterium selenitireducens]